LSNIAAKKGAYFWEREQIPADDFCTRNGVLAENRFLAWSVVPRIPKRLLSPSRVNGS
jgi:hypothetical protein